MRRRLLLSFAAACMASRAASAQTPVAINAELTFYGDNTEFANPYREGQTLLGVEGRLFLDAGLSERVSLRLGVFGNLRFGAEHGVDDVKPVITLVVRGPENRFLFGAIDHGAARDGAGPDRDGPHALLPPLQRETLAFTRGYEAGLQWIRRAPRERHDAWINWQQLNTPGQREVFDAGLNARASLTPAVSAALQAHIVHHGGQLFADGPVSDSAVIAPGVIVSRATRWLESVSGEAFVLRSFHRPDREAAERTARGLAIFLRVAAERAGWRGHLIVWRGCDFIKEEGDPNYLSITRDGMGVRQTRDYAEIGVTRRYRLADGSELEASARVHRVEQNYGYSYRVLARVRARWEIF